MTPAVSVRSSATSKALLALILLTALILRWPGISERMPYFTHEDEAHHYNRLLDMYKSGDLNPHYFHKPSLHFYLRLPVVAAAIWWAKRQGAINSAQELVTRDPYGLADYAFSVSHPGILKWSRAFSVLLSMLLVFFTWSLARRVLDGEFGALMAASLAAVSPPLVAHAPIIGVDVLMALLCLVSVYFCVRLYQHFSYTSLFFAGLAAGLAVSSKYNAGPILILPLAACYLANKIEMRTVLLSILLPIIGFFLGSPYILVSLNLFREHLSYEVWHYAVAGHTGHMANPGVEQALFYLSWFKDEALGTVCAILALAGFLILLLQSTRRHARLGLLLYLFPLLFFALMIMQKTNFTRNMLVLVPFLAIFAAHFLGYAAKTLSMSQRASRLLLFAVYLAALAYPFFVSCVLFKQNLSVKDSRSLAYDWLKAQALNSRDCAVSGQLQMSAQVLTLPGVSRINQDVVHPIDLYLSGFDVLLRGPQDPFAAELAGYTKEQVRFAGSTGRDRIVIDPEIKILSFEAGPELEKAIAAQLEAKPAAQLVFNFSGLNSTSCGLAGQSTRETEAEGYCWLSARRQVVKLRDLGLDLLKDKTQVALVFSLMNPWPNQKAKLELAGHALELTWGPQDLNNFKEFRLELPGAELLKSSEVSVHLTQVHAPQAQGINSDRRRLGIAIDQIRLE